MHVHTTAEKVKEKLKDLGYKVKRKRRSSHNRFFRINFQGNLPAKRKT